MYRGLVGSEICIRDSITSDEDIFAFKKEKVISVVSSEYDGSELSLVLTSNEETDTAVAWEQPIVFKASVLASADSKELTFGVRGLQGAFTDYRLTSLSQETPIYAWSYSNTPPQVTLTPTPLLTSYNLQLSNYPFHDISFSMVLSEKCIGVTASDVSCVQLSSDSTTDTAPVVTFSPDTEHPRLYTCLLYTSDTADE